MRRLLAALASLALAGCVVGPSYRHPESAPSTQSGFVAARPGTVAADPLPAGWWHLYQDAELDSLVADALVANTDLRVAAANLQRAEAALREVRTQRLPTTEVGGSVVHGRGSVSIPGVTRIETLPSTSSVTESTVPNSTVSGGPAGNAGTLFSGVLGVAYQVDLFGRITRSIQAARADAESTEATEDAVRVTVAADTTDAYLQTCTLQEQIDVAKASLDLVSRSYQITRRQVQLGAASDYDLSRIGVLVEQTRDRS